MSAGQVGQVYLKIIDDVITDSASTFDEDGVERRLLDDLKNTWQEKLSARHVSEMPWDPPPIPQPLPMPMSNGNAAVNASPAATSTPVTNSQPVKNEPVIKQEPTYVDYPATNVVSAAQQGAGSQRAGQFIQDKFGSAAIGSLNALNAQEAARTQAEQTRIARQQAQAQQPSQSTIPVQLPPNLVTAEAQRQQYNRMLAEQMRQQQARTQQRTATHGQTDGADEWKTFLAERRALSDEAVKAADLTLRQRIEQAALEQEGGGVMVPASRIKPRRIPVNRDPALKQAQVDGGDDDDAEDEDAINSDLDDPDDDPGVGSDDEDNNGEVMVCLYDKVQRVKNKWKCTLKDGVLSTGGKEYVFGKAQGEFEW